LARIAIRAYVVPQFCGSVVLVLAW
jgi:hypothetical protein